MVFKRRDRRPLWKVVADFFWPRGGWTRAFHYVKHRLRRLPDPPHRIARGIFAGIFVTFTPFFGLHFFLAASLAWIMRGNIVAALLATFVGNPLTFVLIAASSLQTGYFLLGMGVPVGHTVERSLGGKFVDAGADLKHNLWAMFTEQPADWSHLKVFYDAVFFPYMVGGLIPGLIAALIGYYVSLPLIQAYQNRRKGVLKAKLAALKEKPRIRLTFATNPINLPETQNGGGREMANEGKLRLGVNIDHVATLRNARGGAYPDPVRAAKLAEGAGADGITAHLREDRRHIVDSDIDGLMAALEVPLNFEMAATPEMQAIALRHRPHAVCIVPEKREERTTEGGLDVAGDDDRLADFIAPLREAGCRVSLFIGHEARQIEASARIGAAVVELHTGAYCDYHYEGDFAKRDKELEGLQDGAALAHSLGLEVHAGHGLTYETVAPVAAMPEVMELNIGHFLMGEAIFRGLGPAIAEMRRLMDEARA